MKTLSKILRIRLCIMKRVRLLLICLILAIAYTLYASTTTTVNNNSIMQLLPKYQTDTFNNSTESKNFKVDRNIDWKRLVVERDQYITSISDSSIYDRKGTVVIIMAYYRSGSSFFGELFNRNPDVFYLFEPLLPYTPNCGRLYKERLELLYNISKCDFRFVPDAYKLAHSITGYRDENIGCLSTNICFNRQHPGLTQRFNNLCTIVNNQFNNSIQEKHLRHLAEIEREQKQDAYMRNTRSPCKKPYNTSLESAICQTSQIVAYKILRVCDIERLESIYSKLTKQGSTVKIIHLVRDPRAMTSSGLQLELSLKSINNHTLSLCNHMRRNLHYLRDKLKENGILPKENVLEVRYEDMVSNLFANVEKIYSFIGHQVPPGVRQWLKETSIQPALVLAKYRKQMDNPELSIKQRVNLLDRIFEIKKDLMNPYGTARNPRSVLAKWRHNLPFAVTDDVQKQCSDVMKTLSYKIVSSVDEQKELKKKLW